MANPYTNKNSDTGKWFLTGEWYGAQVDGSRWLMRYSDTQEVGYCNTLHVSALITGDTLQENTTITNSEIERMMAPIDQSEVDQAILNVLMKKGYVLGANVNLWNSDDSITYVKLIDHNGLLYSDDLQNIMMGDVMVRNKGEWMGISPSNSNLIQKLKALLNSDNSGKDQFLIDILSYTIESYEKHRGTNNAQRVNP
jgi:hypothetical protein